MAESQLLYAKFQGIGNGRDIKINEHGIEERGGSMLRVTRVLDSRSRGCGSEPPWRHCVVSMSKTFYPLLSTG